MNLKKYFVMNQKGEYAFCAICKTKTNRRCSRCLNIFYCNREHQRADWKRHKSECLPKSSEEKSKKVENVSVTKSANSQIKQDINDDILEKDCIKSPAETECNNKVNSKSSSGSTKCKHTEGITVNNSTIKNSISTAVVQEHSVNKISELSLLQNNNSDANVVFSKDLMKESAITYEGSSEYEILNESAQQLNSIDFMKTDNSANVKCLNNSKMPIVISSGIRKAHKDYPEAVLKNQVTNNFVLNASDPCYEICQRVIRDMTRYGVCVLDNFLGRDKGLLVLKEVLQMYQSGIFTAGQLVSNPGSTEAQTIRSDRITWIDGKESQCQYIGNLINQVDNIVLGANKMQNNGKLGDYVINGRTKAMVACYPGSGSHYVKHVDNPNKDGRCITAIYYLNLDWDVNKNGGLLRVFPEGTDTVANIQPIFDRMLFFWSDRRNPHEVQPAFATRYAITLWYFDSQERENALRLYKSRAQAKASSSK